MVCRERLVQRTGGGVGLRRSGGFSAPGSGGGIADGGGAVAGASGAVGPVQRLLTGDSSGPRRAPGAFARASDAGAALRLWAAGLAVVGLLAARSAAGVGFVEDFVTDPIASGRWTVLEGDPGRFQYDAGARTLTAHYDTGLPTARLARPLGASVTQNGWARVTVEFEIRSAGFYADPNGFAQIAFGLINRTRTGPDRSSLTANAYDVLNVDYFPNISEQWGGPSLCPTIITSDPGTGFWDAVKYEWGSETLLDDDGESPLPLDVRLTAHLDYAVAGGVGRAVLRVAQNGMSLPINLVGKGNPPGTGGTDGDPTTIVTTIEGDAFRVDAFGLLLWNDSWAVGSSVIADVVFYGVSVDVRPPADMDRDGDVDLADFISFQACFNGPNRPPKSDCAGQADFDGDGDVDLADFGAFQDCFNGPNRAPGAGCS